jgi:hypothetical protein
MQRLSLRRASSGAATYTDLKLETHVSNYWPLRMLRSPPTLRRAPVGFVFLLRQESVHPATDTS